MPDSRAQRRWESRKKFDQMSGALRETTRLIAKFAANRPIGWSEQNFMLLPNQANVMSPILVISPFPGSAFFTPVRLSDKSLPSNGSPSIYEEPISVIGRKNGNLHFATVGRHHANASMAHWWLLFAEQHDKATPRVVSLKTLYRTPAGVEPCGAKTGAILRAFWDYSWRRFGDCPAVIRHWDALYRVTPPCRHRQASRQVSNCSV